MAEELISVVVPIYNVENYLAECIECIINQKYNNLEIILVDDGSNDSSGKICDDYASIDSRIKVIHKKNGGLSDARNCGISICRGEYITLIDSDDLIEVNFIKTLYEAQKKTNSDLVCCEMVCFYDSDQEKLYNYWKKLLLKKCNIRIYNPLDILEAAFYQKISITGAPQKLYRRKLFENILFPTGRYFEDLATTYEFILKSNQICVIDQKLYAYRMRNDSIMNRSFNEQKLDCIWVADKLYKEICELQKGLEKAAACAAFRVNRLVFDQIPFKSKKCKLQVWNEIKIYRKQVVVDKKAQKYERGLALLSYFGMHFFTLSLKIFRVMRKMKYKTDL